MTGVTNTLALIGRRGQRTSRPQRKLRGTQTRTRQPKYWRRGKGTGSFAFLGFTHYRAKTLQGGWTIKRKTLGKRLCRFLSGIAEWCKENRHEAVEEQCRILSAKLRGHYQYYGVRGNYKMLEVAYEHTQQVWKRWLARRNSKNRMSWAGFAARVLEFFELPKPRIIHAF